MSLACVFSGHTTTSLPGIVTTSRRVMMGRLLTLITIVGCLALAAEARFLRSSKTQMGERRLDVNPRCEEQEKCDRQPFCILPWMCQRCHYRQRCCYDVHRYEIKNDRCQKYGGAAEEYLYYYPDGLQQGGEEAMIVQRHACDTVEAAKGCFDESGKRSQDCSLGRQGLKTVCLWQF